jgi:hypothetical protein
MQGIHLLWRAPLSLTPPLANKTAHFSSFTHARVFISIPTLTDGRLTFPALLIVINIP